MTVEIRQSTADPVAVDTGNISVQGRVVSKTIQLSLFTLNKNAVWGGRQHLLKSSYPFAMLQLVANRKVFRYEVGDCFKYSYPKHGINNAIFRVLQKEEQELESENIVISAIEDFYFISQVIDEYTIPTDYTGIRPDYTLIPFVKQMVMEVPYAMTISPEIEILAVACREGEFDLGFDSYISIDNGASYSSMSDDVRNLAPFGQIVDLAYPKTYTIDDTETGFIIEFRNETDAAFVETTTWANTIAGIENIALLGNEIIFFKTITPVSGLKYRITDVIRGRMDTVKADHAIGTDFYVLNGVAFLSHGEIVTGANRDFKLVPYNTRKRGSISLAIPIDFNIVGRWRMPYIPGNFNANGGNFAARYDNDIILTWSPRYRGKGAGVGIPGVVLAEADREGLFEIEVYGDDIYIETILAIDAATYTYVGAIADKMLFKLLNYRTENGILYESAQAEVICKRNYVPLS